MAPIESLFLHFFFYSFAEVVFKGTPVIYTEQIVAQHTCNLLLWLSAQEQNYPVLFILKSLMSVLEN